MVKMTAKRLVAGLLACGLGLMLTACGANYVADYWPHFAGGEPNDVPPRPGTPGYKDFIAHGQSAEGANAPPSGTAAPAAGVSPEFAARQPGGAQQTSVGAPAAAPAPKPVSAAPQAGAGDQNVGQGGLY